MSLLREAQETLRQWRSESLAVPIVYRRRALVTERRDNWNDTSLPPEPAMEGVIQATMASTTVTLDNGTTISKSKIVDWLVDLEQLDALAVLWFGIYQGDVNGPLSESRGGRYANQPMRGDEIEFEGKRYQVSDSAGDHCWRWHGSLQETYRIHTLQVSLENIN